MAEDIYEEVNFKKYCETCEHKDLDEKFDLAADVLIMNITPKRRSR
mgnify:CR=1 FL=1